MRVQSSRFSVSRSVLPKSSFTFLLMLPDAFFSTWRNASYSPWMSARKCSVPLGRLRMACRLMISVLASATVGNDCASNCRYLMSLAIS